MKQPKYAGMFYEKAVSLLDEQIKECFIAKRGPGAIPSSIANKKVNAVISPHAGYPYSGEAMAWSFKAIAEQGLADLYVIIGPNHSSNESGLTTETFQTPYEMLRVDQTFARELIKKGHIKENNKIFDTEHSIEVQLPFLQFVFKKQLEKIKILPIIIGHDSSRKELKQLAIDIKETALDLNKNIKMIVSSDFIHYGPRFGFIPFEENKKQSIYELDEKAINLIKGFKADEFLDFVEKEMLTICGALPIYLLLNIINSGEVCLEQYYTSADLEENSNYRNSVSYASIVFQDK